MKAHLYKATLSRQRLRSLFVAMQSCIYRVICAGMRIKTESARGFNFLNVGRLVGPSVGQGWGGEFMDKIL